jgi:ABC-type sugar transport system ATPase subunit
MIALRCKELAKSYGAVQALRNITFSLKKGEVMGILGGNGSGKSTLTKILGGAVTPSAGEIELYGEVCKLLSPAKSKKKGIIITSQELSLFTNLSVEENLLLCNLPTVSSLFVNKKELKRRARAVLEKIDMVDLLDKKVSELPANQQYLIELAKALVQQPNILLIDEITSALYREEVEIVKKVVRELKQEGCSVLFISHRMPEIYSMCDSVTVIRNGETIGTFGLKEKTENELLSLMSGREISDMEMSSSLTSFHTQQKEETLLSVPSITLAKFRTEFNLDIKAGEIIGIAGLQGHGQSDLVRTLFGMMEPVSLQLEGKDYTFTKTRDAVQAGLAFVSGDREKEGVFPGRPVSENMSVVQEMVRKKNKVNEQEILQDYGVVLHTSKQPITTLSGGNQQKVVIGRWTASQPRVLLADDPTKGIDVQARRDVHRILRNLASEGSAVVMVSSDDEELVELTKPFPSSRILVMYEGRITRTLTGSEITTENIISAANPKGA